jgi:hypothetical protein
VILGVVHRADEDDRRRLGARTLADERRGLEAVHARHVHVEQDDGELLLQQATQCLLARRCLDQILTELLQQHLVREELIRAVINDQDIYLLVGAGLVVSRFSHAQTEFTNEL